MKLSFKVVAAAVLALALAGPAQAISIGPGDAILTGVETGVPKIYAEIAVLQPSLAALVNAGTELYKQNAGAGGTEVGSLAGSYQTVFANTLADPSDATITYVGGPVVGPTAYALVKDGNQDPAWYLFNLTALGWNGTATLYFEDFWPTQGAISHVSLYGTRTSVPDGGSMVMLLGAALMGLGAFRRFVK